MIIIQIIGSLINNVRVALSAESGLTLKVEEIEDYSITEKNPNGKRSHRDILLKTSSPSRKREVFLFATTIHWW